jgi:hypothetical protein
LLRSLKNGASRRRLAILDVRRNRSVVRWSRWSATSASSLYGTRRANHVPPMRPRLLHPAERGASGDRSHKGRDRKPPSRSHRPRIAGSTIFSPRYIVPAVLEFPRRVRKSKSTSNCPLVISISFGKAATSPFGASAEYFKILKSTLRS